MTAILNKIRMLEASRNSGALSAEDFERAKARLLDTIEDAVDPDAAPAQAARTRTTPVQTRKDRRKTDRAGALPASGPPTKSIWPIVLLCGVATVGATALATLLIGDITLALTLVATVIAAITVRAMRLLDD